MRNAYSTGGAASPLIDISVSGSDVLPEGGHNFLYIHGMEENLDIWRPMAAHLNAAGRHFALDLPWSGRNGYDWLHDDTPMEHRIPPLHTLGPDLVVVSHSYGGLVLLDHLQQNGCHGIKALVLVSPFYRFADSAFTMQELRYFWRNYDRFICDALAIRMPRAPDRDILRRMGRQVRDKIGPAGCIEFLHRFNRTARIDLGCFKLPVLVISGENDYYCPIEQSVRISRAFPNGKFRLMKHSGHFCMLERSKEAAGHIADFLKTETQAQQGGEHENGNIRIDRRATMVDHAASAF